MGITGLLPFVKNSCRSANIKDFSGSTVAIDAYSWLHKGAFSCAEKLVKGEKTDGYVFYCIKQLNMILDAGLKPIMVFDGCNLCSKAVTEKKRRDNRVKARQRGKEFLCEGKVKEARECFQRCVDVTPEMAREVIMACQKKGVDCIVAPYEADAQLAYLDKIGMAQLIITEDSDLILFGCNRILFKMDNCGGGLLFEKENLPKSLGAKATKFSFEKFRYMCILSGCDYLPSLPGIGLVKACKFFTLTNNTDLLNVLPKLPSYLKMPKLVVSNEYKDSFIKANNTFLYQLVFCPQKKGMVPLNPYPDDIKPSDMEYAGKYLSDDMAYQIAMGNVNVKTMEEFDTYHDSPVFDDDKSVVWGSQKSLGNTSAVSKVEISAFKFSTPKQKSPACRKRQFKETTIDTGNSTCTDEELFAMYSRQDPEKSCTQNNSLEDEQIVLKVEETSSKDSPSSQTNSFENSPHPKILNIPFRKIVKSRFFTSESQQSKDVSSSSFIASAPEEKESEKSFLSKSPHSTPEEVTLHSENNTNAVDGCDFSLQLKIASPKKENKENIVHRFAKRKIASISDEEKSPSKKLINDTCLDIIDNESDAATSTVSSSGKATKLLDVSEVEFSKPACPNNLSKFKQKTKRLITTRIQDFKWSKNASTRVKVNTSLGSDGNSCDDESFESVPEADVKRRASSLGVPSPYFQAPASSQESMDYSTCDVMSETEDIDSPDICVLDTSFNKTVSTMPKETPEKVLKPINNKSKPGPCRTLGLSKRKKTSPQVPRKETLLNFNFIRQPKKEVSIT